MSARKILNKILTNFGYEIHRKVGTIDFTEKHIKELTYWIHRFSEENRNFANGHYKKIMLGMAQEENDSFLNGKIVADFGCGPRGSLVWTNAPKLRIGIDVIVDKYYDCFGEEMINDGYLYIQSTEKYIPIPTNFVDVVYTMNSMDHTANFEVMLNEIFRILKPGGEFIGSFNMNEPATTGEPQTLTFHMMRDLLFSRLDIQHKLTAYKGNRLEEKRGTYDCFFDKNAKQPSEKDLCILWIRGRKK
jgi:SAM-dependent methyltransferase